MNILEVLLRGGWIMAFICLSSIVVIALGISRFISVQREKSALSKFVEKWRVAPPGTDPLNFVASCKSASRFTREMSSIFNQNVQSRKELSERIEATGRQELYRLESGIGVIATLASVTPLLGFLGTVTGMIKAFMQIQQLGGNVNANVLAGGIWEALVTTAAGLAVGILALVIHNYLVGMIRTATQMIEQIGEITLKILGSIDEA